MRVQKFVHASCAGLIAIACYAGGSAANAGGDVTWSSGGRDYALNTRSYHDDNDYRRSGGRNGHDDGKSWRDRDDDRHDKKWRHRDRDRDKEYSKDRKGKKNGHYNKDSGKRGKHKDFKGKGKRHGHDSKRSGTRGRR